MMATRRGRSSIGGAAEVPILAVGGGGFWGVEGGYALVESCLLGIRNAPARVVVGAVVWFAPRCNYATM